ncbi:MAG: 2-C-methyl-D-erythritol 4-phosphate cytidylyltransferase [Parachlamydiaceae bacterium]|nr:2-C-methyl-D-erythritol 4-phosphate cytidylyltransferase [Parachlamydiaceae bacterium]
MNYNSSDILSGGAKNSVSVILLAGGSGSRMLTPLPKQFLKLNKKPIALYSFEKFLQISDVTEIIVVCHEEYRYLFEVYEPKIPLKYALPGLRRQDSVFNGFKEIDSNANLVCIHDAARPFVTLEAIRDVIDTAMKMGASCVATPLKSTVKQADASKIVVQTPDRSTLWEIQTPQAICPKLLARGFAVALEKDLTVTDDVSLVELLNLPVKLVLGSYTNIKVTTPEDLLFAEKIAECQAKV